MFIDEPQNLTAGQTAGRSEAQAHNTGAQEGAGRAAEDEKVLPSQVRAHNRALVLRTLFRNERLSRADLARSTGLTKVSVSLVVGELLVDNLITEVGVRTEARRGKPAIMLEFNNDGHQVIALELSHSTVFRGALLSLTGEVLTRRDVLIEGRMGQEALDAVLGLTADLKADAKVPVLGIGVGTPGIVNRAGRILSAPSRGWTDLPMAATLSDQIGVPASVMNAANIAILAERSFAQGPADMLLVRVGTSVSAGLLLDGTLILGSRFAAGEIGHYVVDGSDSRRCVCGQNGCLDTWLSTPRLADDLAKATTPEERDHVLAVAGQVLGSVLAPIVAALNLREIILSGPPLALEGVLANAALDVIRHHGVTGESDQPTLRLSSLGDDIVMRGAAAMVLNDQLGIS